MPKLVKIKDNLSLFAPDSYDPSNQEDCNGCGAKDSLLKASDSIWFMDVRPACCIHDHMYSVGKTINDKAEADRVFLNNMVRIAQYYKENGLTFLDRIFPKFIYKLRLEKIKLYYMGVHLFGGPAFWINKDPFVHKESKEQPEVKKI